MIRAGRSMVVITMALIGAGHALPVTAAGDPDTLDAARAGLARYLADHRPATAATETDFPDCPAIGLERFQGALDATGVDAPPLRDWGTAIEWDEWQEIDPALMSIACEGDVDGDAQDRNAQLGAGIAVVDAGTEERALEVEQQVGFGALNPEPADVPGGELMATCLDSDGLSLCSAVWSVDGFLVGVVVGSDQLNVPDGAAAVVLVDVLDDVVATLAAYQSDAVEESTAELPATAPTATTDANDDAEGLLDVDAARAGLTSRLAGVEPISELEPLADCPVAERNDVVDALEVAGVDTPIESLVAEQGPALTDGTTWLADGLVCTGVYVGAGDDPSFPELRMSVVVADFGDRDGFDAYLADLHPGVDPGGGLPTPTIGGSTIGECADVDLTDRCSEYWEQDGFVVGVQLADRVFMDRPTASAVLVELISAVVSSLAAAPAAAEPVEFAVSQGELDAARAGLANLVAAGDPGDAGDCALVDRAALGSAFVEAGLELDSAELTGQIMLGDEGDPELGVGCTARDAVTDIAVVAQDFGDRAAAQDVIELARGCESVGPTRYCVESWQQDGLTVTLTVATGDEIAGGDVVSLLDALVPVVVENLAALS